MENFKITTFHLTKKNGYDLSWRQCFFPLLVKNQPNYVYKNVKEKKNIKHKYNIVWLYKNNNI